MAALYIGFSLDLSRPYWAMLTAYITAQPFSATVRSKGTYRVIGTFFGAAATVALIPNLVDSPELLSLALAMWVGLCLFLSLLDRTPQSYIFLLSGYSAAIIGFPAVTAPQTIFAVAVIRVEEICLGIICATIAHSLFFPHSVVDALIGSTERFLSAASIWVRDALTGIRTLQTDHDRRRLAADTTDLRLLATNLPFESSGLRPSSNTVRALQDQLSLLLPLATAVEDRLEALQNAGYEPDAELRDLIAQIDRFAGATNQPAISLREAQRLSGLCNAMQPALDVASNWQTLLKASLLYRLTQLIDTLQDCRDLRAMMLNPRLHAPRRLRPLLRADSDRPLHLDYGLAFRSAFAAMVAIMVCCALWIGLAWPEGAVAALFAAIACSFFATQDDPAMAIANFLIYSTLALPVAALYLFLILPAIDGFPLLALVLAPVLLPMGYFIGDAQKAQHAVPFMMGFVGSLSLTETFNADFASFANTSFGQIVGFSVALVVTQLLRSASPQWSSWRILRTGWRELAALAQAKKVPNRLVWTSHMLDRLGLLTARLPLAATDERLAAADALNDLRIGFNVVDLHEAKTKVSPDAQRAIGEMLRGLGQHFRSLAASKATPKAAPQLLKRLDTAIAKVIANSPQREVLSSVVALTGLRRSLFPQAESYQPVSEAPL